MSKTNTAVMVAGNQASGRKNWTGKELKICAVTETLSLFLSSFVIIVYFVQLNCDICVCMNYELFVSIMLFNEMI